MNIKWAVIFAEVAADGSITRLAKRLNVAQPWISAQIQKLETEFGVKLFERLSTGLELTPEGRELLPHAQQIAAAFNKFRDLARTMGDVRSKTVRIGSHLPMFTVPALRTLNDEFIRRYSQYSLLAKAEVTPSLLSNLRLGLLDVVATISPFEDENKGEFSTINLGILRPYLLAPASSKLAVSPDWEGEVIAAPPLESQPCLFHMLLEPLRMRGALIRPVPEVDKAAMEHFARTQKVAVLMLDGDAKDYDNDSTMAGINLADAGIAHILIRMSGRDCGRATERYWALAQAQMKNLMN